MPFLWLQYNYKTTYRTQHSYNMKHIKLFIKCKNAKRTYKIFTVHSLMCIDCIEGPFMLRATFFVSLLCFKGYKRNTTLDSPSKVSEVEQALGNEIAAMPSSLNLNSIKAIKASTSNQYSGSLVKVSEASFKKEISVMPYFTTTEMPKVEDRAGDMDAISETPEPSSFTGSSEVPSTKEPIGISLFKTEDTIQHIQFASIPQTVSSIDLHTLPSVLPGNFLNKDGQSIQTYSSHQTKACDNQDLTEGLPSETDSPHFSVPSLDKDVGVFFSLQFTNMIFSEDLLNRSSPGYKTLENTFIELVCSLTFFSFHGLYK